MVSTKRLSVKLLEGDLIWEKVKLKPVWLIGQQLREFSMFIGC